MPRKALRCVVELQIFAVSCPGVWLPNRNDLYLSICLFGQWRKTRLCGPSFPLMFHETFKFDKIFYTAYEPSQVAEHLEDEDVKIELVQISDILDRGRLLARHQSTARSFLYPNPTFSPIYGTTDREILMDRSLEFPGIAPKLEFSTKTVIKETDALWMDPMDYYLAKDGPSYSKYSPRPGTGHRSRSRARSMSPPLYKQLDYLTLDDSYDYVYDDETKPPFVVRKVNENLIGRVPGTKDPRVRRYKRVVTKSPSSSMVVKGSGAYDSYLDGYHPWYEKAVLPVSPVSPRYAPRPSSPLTYRRSLADRFDYGLTSPSLTESINRRVNSALRRNKSLDRLHDLSASCTPSYYSRHNARYDYDDPYMVDDLEPGHRRYYYNY